MRHLLTVFAFFLAVAPWAFAQTKEELEEELEYERRESEASKIGDDERFSLLKPEMTKAEAEKVWFGKKLRSQGCGVGWKDGKTVMFYGNSYDFELSDGTKFPMSFTFLDYELSGFSGPGFRYKLKGDTFVRHKVDVKATQKPVTLPK